VLSVGYMAVLVLVHALALTIGLLRQIVDFTSHECFDCRSDTLIDSLDVVVILVEVVTPPRISLDDARSRLGDSDIPPHVSVLVFTFHDLHHHIDHFLEVRNLETPVGNRRARNRMEVVVVVGLVFVVRIISSVVVEESLCSPVAGGMVVPGDGEVLPVSKGKSRSSKGKLF
jgi:hypothetical protein